jgi:hypothetical protein
LVDEVQMRLTEEQSRSLLVKHGAYVTEVCDKCGKILGPVRFTRYGQTGEWCSDGFERKAGTCLGCGVPLNGKRKGAVFCSDVSRKRWRVEALRVIAETSIQNSGLTDEIWGARYVHGLNSGKPTGEALIAKIVTPTVGVKSRPKQETFGVND